MASLQRVSPPVILLDLALGNPDVLGTVWLIHRTKPEIPLIVIGDSAKKEIAVASLREGAINFFSTWTAVRAVWCMAPKRSGEGATAAS